MSAIALILLVAVLTLLQVFVPGKPWYHSGGYAVALLAACALALWVQRGRKRGILLAGTALVAASGVLCSLLAPDTQTVIPAAGSTIALAEPAVSLNFPVDPGAPVIVHRNGHRDLFVSRGQDARLPDFVFVAQSRTAAVVRAQDLRGRNLTITQPQNSVFLSPVLSFSQTTAIGKTLVPIDSFAVPAAHRVVRALLLQERGGVLFAIEDERGKMVPGALKFAPSGQTVRVASLQLRARLVDYPAVMIAAIPYLPLLLAGLLLCIAGGVLAVRDQNVVPLEKRNPSIFAAGTTVE